MDWKKYTVKVKRKYHNELFIEHESFSVYKDSKQNSIVVTRINNNSMFRTAIEIEDHTIDELVELLLHTKEELKNE